MKKFFWGFLVIFLNFNLEVNGHSFNLLPDFVGYILIFQGAKELDAESRLFQSVCPFAVGMTVYTAILWVGALLGVGAGGWLSQILNLIAMVVALYISWMLVQAALEMEAKRTADLNGAALYKWWKAQVAAQVAAKLLYLLANIANVGILLGLATLLAIAGMVVSILYLIAWWKGSDAYEALPRQVADGM